jgi:hypothetical protein
MGVSNLCVRGPRVERSLLFYVLCCIDANFSSLNHTFYFHTGVKTRYETIRSIYMFVSFDPRQGQRIFPVASVSRPALGPTQPPVQWVPGVLSLGVKRGRGVTLTTHPI